MPSKRESDLARLKQLLREVDEQAEKERRCAEDAEASPQIEEEKTKATTFEEYLHACHTLLLKLLYMQTGKSFRTHGSITSPKNKPYPAKMKP